MSYFEVIVRRLVSSMCAIVLCCSASSLAFAQASSASLGVTVSDASGAVIPDATATLRNSDTNQQQTSLSNKSGSATFPFLKPGHYVLTVAKAGFSDVTVGSILLNVGDEKHLQLVLKVGVASQNVTVDGDGATLNTSDASVSTVIDRQFVANIPLNGRSFQDLISMTPGVLTSNPQTYSEVGYSGDFSVNGQRTESNNYVVDGVSGNVAAGNGYAAPGAATAGEVPAATALGTTQSLLSVDAMQEFRVESSTYSAEYGRAPGGQISIATRSGTNALHGTAFDYFRNDIFDANNWFNGFNNAQKPALRQNDFGGTLGGPIRIPWLYNGENSSFFFVSYEGLRLAQPQAATVEYVPDEYMRQAAPAAMLPILDAFPVQTGKDYGTSTSPSLAVFTKSYSVPSLVNATSVRLDHTVSPRLTLFFRVNYTPSSTLSRTLSNPTTQEVDTQTYTLGATSQFRSNVSNEFRLGFAASSSSRISTLDSFGGAQPTSFQQALAGASNYGNYYSGQAELSFSGIGMSELVTGESKNSGNQWNVVDSFIWSHGRHQVKVGVDYLHIRSALTPTNPYVAGLYFSPSAVLNNEATLLGLIVRKNAVPIFEYGSTYIQDEWRLNSRLSLSGGVRWEVAPPPYEAHGNDAYTLLGNPSDPSSLSLAPEGTALWATTFHNFAPRLGVAWQFHNEQGHETVVRAGGGVFFDSDNWAATQGYSGSAIGFSSTQYLFGAAVPVAPSQLNIPISITPPFTSAYAYAFPSHLQLPYTFQWGASLEQALGMHQSLTVSYVASNGRRLLGEQRFDFTASQSADFRNIYLFNANQTSSYNSLQVKFQRAVAHGLQALASYVWSHSIDFGSETTALPSTRADSDFDVRQNVSAGVTWDIPATAHGAVERALVSDWGLDGRIIARTAFPLTISGNLLTDSLGEQYYSGANFVAGQPYYLYSNTYPGGKALNPAAFVANSSATENGTVPRNFFRGFDEAQLNLSVRRTFRLSESTSLQFHADSFNLPNHPNFGAVDTTLSDALFGQATSTLNESLATVASQYQQGGPRSFQFSLKLLF